MNKTWIWIALAAVVGAVLGWFGRGCRKGNDKKVKDEVKELAEEAKEGVEETAKKAADAVKPEK